jgi:hypothetical protein
MGNAAPAIDFGFADIKTELEKFAVNWWRQRTVSRQNSTPLIIGCML